MLLFYVRHGDPIYEPDSLTQLGHRQAEALAKRLAVYGLDEIYSSTSNRAYLSALPTAHLLKKEVQQVEFFNEAYAAKYFSTPDVDGVSRWVELQDAFRKLAVSKELTALGDEWYAHRAFGAHRFAEGISFFNDNIDAFLLSLGLRHNRAEKTYTALCPNQKRVAIFAHGGFGGVFLSSVLDIPYPQFVARHSMSHTGMTVIEFADEGEDIIPVVLQFNSDSHLYKEGIPTLHCNVTPV